MRSVIYILTEKPLLHFFVLSCCTLGTLWLIITPRGRRGIAFSSFLFPSVPHSFPWNSLPLSLSDVFTHPLYSFTLSLCFSLPPEPPFFSLLPLISPLLPICFPFPFCLSLPFHSCFDFCLPATFYSPISISLSVTASLAFYNQAG